MKTPEAAYTRSGRECDGSGGGGRRGRRRLAPGAGIAAGDHPVDQPATMPAPVMISR